MSLEAYKRNYNKDKVKENKLNNQEIIFRITQNELFKQKDIINPLNRLTGNKGTSHSMPKNKNTIIHSNSTNHMRQQNKNNANLKENNYNIININVNNLIINNNVKENNKHNNDNRNNNINNKVFSKIGNDIIDSKNVLNNETKRIQPQVKNNRGYSNPKSLKKKVLKEKEKYNALSNIQGVINNLMEVTKCSPPPFDNKLNMINPTNEDTNMNIIDNNKSNNSLVKENQINLSVSEKYIEIHLKLWEIMISMEIHAENKIGLSNQIKRMLSSIETDFIANNSNDNKVITDIFINNQINYIYNKIIKIFFVLVVYFKFLLLDFNFEMTIKSNIKRLMSSMNENLLSILNSQVFLKEKLQENNGCTNIKKEFIDVYTKILKTKKIKKNIKDNLTAYCNNIKKNLEICLSTIKQFSNNFFKIGYFSPIHNICLDIFRLIDNYKVENVSNIIINNILFFILKSNQSDKKSAPKLVSFGTVNTLAALGFMNVPAPYLSKLPPEVETSTYTLVLDLDETLTHFFYTPSGGTFLVRPYCLQFLEEMSKIFEIIIFTAALKDYADSILDVLDPNKTLINYRLYRHHTSICGITFCKDLSKIGRDLNRTIIVDNLADNFKLQPNNGIPILTWIDDMKDTQLFDLGKILKDLLDKKPLDIRPIIKKLKDDMNKKLRNNMNANPFKGIDINKYLK